MTGVAILIPAAGRAARMDGRDKLLEEVDGVPLLRRQAAMALGLDAPVLVTLPGDRPARCAALAGLEGLRMAVLSDACEGIAASIRAGAGWAEALGAAGLMILLADMPDLESGDLGALMRAFAADPGTPLRASDETGRPGHPVILPARLFADLRALSGDRGAQALLAGHKVARLTLPGARATTDLDTPEDWAAWRAARARGRS